MQVKINKSKRNKTITGINLLSSTNKMVKIRYVNIFRYYADNKEIDVPRVRQVNIKSAIKAFFKSLFCLNNRVGTKFCDFNCRVELE